MRSTSRDSNVFQNIPDGTSRDSYEAHHKKWEYDEEDHACLKASKEDDIEVTSLTNNQMFKPNIDLVKENWEISEEH